MVEILAPRSQGFRCKPSGKHITRVEPTSWPKRGLAERRGPRVILAPNLPGTLRNRELAPAAKGIAAETGLEHRPVGDGQRVAGIYRRSVMLASGRYAMFDDGKGFSSELGAMEVSN